MQKPRYQIIPLSIPLAQAANSLYENDEVLDRAYNRITGIAFAVLDDAGLGNDLLLGVRTARTPIVDPIPVQLWEAGDAVAPNLKFLDVNEGYGAGDVLFAQGTPLSALSGNAADIRMVVRLVADLVELPRV